MYRYISDCENTEFNILIRVSKFRRPIERNHNNPNDADVLRVPTTTQVTCPESHWRHTATPLKWNLHRIIGCSSNAKQAVQMSCLRASATSHARHFLYYVQTRKTALLVFAPLPSLGAQETDHNLVPPFSSIGSLGDFFVASHC